MLIGRKASVWPWRTGTVPTSLALITASTTLTIETGASTRTTWLTGQHHPLLQLWTEPPQLDAGMGLCPLTSHLLVRLPAAGRPAARGTYRVTPAAGCGTQVP